MTAARLSPGAISESSSIHLPPSEVSKMAKPVMFPPGWLSRGAMPLATGSPPFHRDDRDRPRLPLEGNGHPGRVCQDDVGLQADQLLHERSCPIDVIAGPPKVDPHVAAFGPTQARKRLRERRDLSLCHGIVFVARLEHADAPYAVALLRPQRERPRRSHGAEEGEEVASSHHVTSFNQLVRSQQEGFGDCEADRLRSDQVHRKSETDRLFYRNVSRSCPPQNLVNKFRGASE